jgi:hypothetical protein
LFGARSETEIKQQLAEIERAAKEAVAADRLESTGLFYKVTSLMIKIIFFAFGKNSSVYMMMNIFGCL